MVGMMAEKVITNRDFPPRSNCQYYETLCSMCIRRISPTRMTTTVAYQDQNHQIPVNSTDMRYMVISRNLSGWFLGIG